MTWACCVCGMPDGIERVGMARSGLTVCDKCVHALPAFAAMKAQRDDALARLKTEDEVSLYDARVSMRATIGDLADLAGIKTSDVSSVEFGREPIKSEVGKRYLWALAHIAMSGDRP